VPGGKPTGKPQALNRAPTSLQEVGGSTIIVPLVVPEGSEAVHEHVAPGSVHVTV
jgi:hypothetical protein